MNKTLVAIVVAVLVLGGIAWYVYESRPQPAAEPPPVAELTPEPAAPAAPEPVPEAVQPPVQPSVDTPSPEFAEPALPPLAESDAYAGETLSGLVGEAAVLRYFTAENVVAKAVATIDALSGRQVPKPILALQGPGDDYPALEVSDPETVIRDENGDPVPQFVPDPAAYARYTPYVEMLEAVPPAEFVAQLRGNESLFDEAWRQLGYADSRFEDRLARVIDELLATPEVTDPPRLIRPEAYYLFADDRLEALGAGQKLLLRMGTDNASRVKSWLSEVRQAL